MPEITIDEIKTVLEEMKNYKNHLEKITSQKNEMKRFYKF